MDVITKDVRALAKKELAAANRRFRMFASPHEGYAVIREELDELIDEVRKLHFGLDNPAVARCQEKRTHEAGAPESHL